MNIKTSVFIATSLDGFIARKNGDIDWLTDPEEAGDGEDYGYGNFIKSVDALVMGRNTFEKVLSFGRWPYGETPVYVLSSRGITIPGNLRQTVFAESQPPRELLADLETKSYKHIYLDGGKTIQGFLKENLVNNLILIRIPVLIGSGIPLFGALPQDVPLKHLETKAYDNGLVQSRYEVMRKHPLTRRYKTI